MTEAKKQLELKPEVAELSSIITKAIAVDGKAGVVTVTDGLYTDNLPQGITPEVVQQVSDYNTTFVAAGADAFGRAAVAAMATHKSLDRLSLDIPFTGRDHVSYSIDRSKVMLNPSTKEEFTRYGNVSASLEVRAGKNGGQLKTARAMISELAAAKLAKN